jgi:hypothetical protein
MTGILRYIIWFIVLVLGQVLLFGHLEFGFGLHIMIYPLFIIILPFDIKPILVMTLAFSLGILIDVFSNTFGLHASASVLIAYLRPELFRLFAPRDGYDILMKPSINDLGFRWFLSVCSIIIVIHHFWFFFLEYFKWSAWYKIVGNTIISSSITLFIVLALEILTSKKEVRK